MQAAIKFTRLSKQTSSHTTTTTAAAASVLPSFVQRAYVVGKIKAKPKGGDDAPTVDLSDNDMPSEWTRAHFTPEHLKSVAEDRTLELEKRMAALINRDTTYGDAFSTHKKLTTGATSSSSSSSSSHGDNIETDAADPIELFSTQFGMNDAIAEAEAKELYKMDQKNGMPDLVNKPRFRTGIPTMIDPVGETFAKFKQQGDKFYNRNPFKFANVQQLLQNPETREEITRSIKAQLRKQSSPESSSSSSETIDECIDHLVQGHGILTRSTLSEMARFDAITSGANAEELEKLMSVFTRERSTPSPRDIESRLNKLEASSSSSSSDDSHASRVPSDVQVLDSLTYWQNNQLFKQRKFDNFDMNLVVNPDMYSYVAPTSVDKSEVNKLYNVNTVEYNTFFGELGLGGELDKTFERVAQRALLIREPVIPVIELLTQMKKNGGRRSDLNQRGFVFTGIRGGGKSACLAVAAHHAFKNDFLTFYIPSAHHWTHGAHYVEPSVLLKGYFDAPTPSLAFIRQFSKANAKILKKMKLSKAYNLPVELGEKQPTNLFELIQFGVVSEDNASIAFKLLMDELEVNKTVPMAFIVDDYNFFMDNTGFTYGNLADFDTKMPEPVHATQLTLVRGLNRILLSNSPNKVFVTAASNKWRQQNETKLEDYPFEVLNVPRYNETELAVMLDYYFSSYYVEAISSQKAEDLLYLTGAVPSALFHELSVFH